MTALTTNYSKYYRKNTVSAVYPVEFVVRAFLGTYPGLRMDRSRYKGSRVLDLGYGDGRNMPLLRDLGMKVHGVEISEDIRRHVAKRLEKLGIKAVLKTGANARIPYEDAYFDFVVACHSCYYVGEGDTFRDNLAEIARVLAPRGFFIASLPMRDTYILKGARRLPGRHYRITRDPYGLRNGTVFRAFDSPGDIRKTFKPYFRDLRIGFCDDSFWGIRQKAWIVVCRAHEAKN